MNVLCIKENDDGSAVVELDMTQKELSIVIEVGFSKMLKDGMEAFEDVLKRESTENIE